MSGILDLLNSDLGKEIINGIADSTGNNKEKQTARLQWLCPF